MRKGFTLLELIIVIIILGVLATLATTQYSRMIEKSRGAEARIILGAIRTNAAAYYMANDDITGVSDDILGLGSDYPSACTTTHYFSYTLISSGTTNFVAAANRCTSGGKTPNGTAANVMLTTNFGDGTDTWSYSAPY